MGDEGLTSKKEDMPSRDKKDTQKDKFLTFYVGKEEYGIDVGYVTEIINIQTISLVPDMPNFIKGIINLRGKIIPVMDIRIRFRLEPQEYNDRTCIIIANISNILVGLIVDEVKEVANIPENQIEPPPITPNRVGSRFIKGIGKLGEVVIILLDLDKLLYDDELERIKQDIVMETLTEDGKNGKIC